MKNLGSREKEEDDQVNHDREPEVEGLEGSEEKEEVITESGLGEVWRRQKHLMN